MSDVEALRERVSALRRQLEVVRGDLDEARVALRAAERFERELRADRRAEKFEARARRRIVAPVVRRRLVGSGQAVNSVFALGAMTSRD